MSKPEPVYDALYVSNALQRQLGNAARGEVHLFTYLACLLAVYSHRPTADWTYDFAGTMSGAPFSTELDAAIDDCILSGLLSSRDDLLILTAVGQQELSELSNVSFCSWRTIYLEASCCSTLMAPVGTVRNALSQEPNLKPVSLLRVSRRLLDKPGLELLYEQFAALHQAIGKDTRDLFVPATVWLAYLSESAKPSLHEKDNE